MEGQNFQALLLDHDLFAVDRVVLLDHAAGERFIRLLRRLDGLLHRVFHLRGKVADHPLQPDDFLCEMFSHICFPVDKGLVMMPMRMNHPNRPVMYSSVFFSEGFVKIFSVLSYSTIRPL